MAKSEGLLTLQKSRKLTKGAILVIKTKINPDSAFITGQHVHKRPCKVFCVGAVFTSPQPVVYMVVTGVRLAPENEKKEQLT